MDVIDKVLNDYWRTLPEERRFLICGSLYEAERAVLNMIAPKDYSSDEVMSFVFYHLHGEELPNDFFIRRQEWLERKQGKKKGR